MSMEGRFVKPGQIVSIDGCDTAEHEGLWTILDRAPRPAHWWLHRYAGGDWQTLTAHVRQLNFVADPYRPKSRVNANV